MSTFKHCNSNLTFLQISNTTSDLQEHYYMNLKFSFYTPTVVAAAQTFRKKRQDFAQGFIELPRKIDYQHTAAVHARRVVGA